MKTRLSTEKGYALFKQMRDALKIQIPVTDAGTDKSPTPVTVNSDARPVRLVGDIHRYRTADEVRNAPYPY